MLKFEDKLVRCFHIGDVNSIIRTDVNNLLPISRELVLPGDMPFGFLPPGIAGAPALMGPVPDARATALRNSGRLAGLADTGQAKSSFTAISVDERNSHVDIHRVL